MLQSLLRAVPLLLLTTAGGLVPLAASGQEVPRLSEAMLTTYASAHAEIREILGDAHVELARAANKIEEAQTELRREMRGRILAVFEAHGITEEEYDAVTFVLSVDEEQRERFLEIQARAGGGDGDGGRTP
jgi:hypothetical protein